MPLYTFKYVHMAMLLSQYADTNIIDHFELLHDHFSDYFTWFLINPSLRLQICVMK